MEDDLCRKMAFMDDGRTLVFKTTVSVHLFEVVFVFEVVSMFDVVFILVEDDLHGRRPFTKDNL